MEKRDVRDQMVIATKVTTNDQKHSMDEKKNLISNFGGNSHKSLHLSLEASLKKLKTDYIDLVRVSYFNSQIVESNDHFMSSFTYTGGTLLFRTYIMLFTQHTGHD